ncbi:hypothetical protein GIB67_003162 [Kingdonia uniflora]|uniref:Uncharacterized protein n=1 Tax=Kingdonia uniflora TaxID=39325 RepID=A0A7J7N652_9MAGN|nr:hypothetical protein GIB67_003162 [Kingdonia uniflora]
MGNIATADFIQNGSWALNTHSNQLLTTAGVSLDKVSNISYLESIVGVGLSYSDNETDYVTGDLTTAFDTHTFLLKVSVVYHEFRYTYKGLLRAFVLLQSFGLKSKSILLDPET